jgi:oligoendopeptidase F
MHSYDDTVNSMSILAHELGHAMHSYLTNRAQPYVYTNYSLFVAEVASNFNQALVRDYLLRENDDPYLQIVILEEAMFNFHRYFFIMPTLARFEYEVHSRIWDGEPLSSDAMIETMAGYFKEGYGDKLVLDPLRDGITWGQFGHLYNAFYVFQYATGIAAANSLASRVARGEGADSYLNMLNAGSSLYALDALREAGADMTQPTVVEEAFKVLEGYVDRLEGLLKQVGIID